MLIVDSPPLSVLARGLPVRKTLEAVAAMAVHLQPGCRCAILLPGEDGFLLEADRGLLPEDKLLLENLTGLDSLVELRKQDCKGGIEVRPLFTQSSELVGTVVLFDFQLGPSEVEAKERLDEICCVATLGIEQGNILEELSYRANHDALTHLWNRARMEEQIQCALDAASEHGLVTGLVVIGIDAFRIFNEVLGRQAGDQLLRLIAARLSHHLEPGLLLSRSGGDEFTILLPELTSDSRVATLASQVRSWFESPFELAQHELIVCASLGVATSGPGECHSSELQSRADQALLYAKEGARGRVAVFSADMAKTPLERLVMERHLRFALQRREFALHYQPQVRLGANTIVGVEALLRWKHPLLGLISPMTFVPLAEELGIIEEIGEWVLGEAIRQLEIWNDMGWCGMRMAVNVSPKQFVQPEFVSTVAHLLQQSRIKPQDLELEITETALMKNLQHGGRQLERLRALGVQIALDDFGTGHSSLAYLHHLPIDRIKIDRMFIKDVVTSDERPALLSGIIQMGAGIGCAVIAEGVETIQQARALSNMHCEEAQGYLFAKPLAPADLLRWMKSHSAEVAL